jgi:hypothetical protein
MLLTEPCSAQRQAIGDHARANGRSPREGSRSLGRDNSGIPHSATGRRERGIADSASAREFRTRTGPVPPRLDYKGAELRFVLWGFGSSPRKTGRLPR